MLIGGLQPFSMVDYPNKLCATIFTQGCNFRCPYCHNPRLVDPTLFETPLSVEATLQFLATRRGLLDGVCISGGEPTLQPDLEAFISAVRDLGFAIKLDTNGSHPSVLRTLLDRNLLDYIAMDIKSPLFSYQDTTQVGVDQTLIEESIRILQSNPVPHEFRTTYCNQILKQEDVTKIISSLGNGEQLYLQRARAATTLCDHVSEDTQWKDEDISIWQLAASHNNTRLTIR